jgi:hypothetical protein
VNLYVIRNRVTELYLADRHMIERHGMTYTAKLERARTFTSVKAAAAHKTDSDDVVGLAALVCYPDDDPNQ